MTSVPYPAFVDAAASCNTTVEQRASLAAVGRCRIHLDALTDPAYASILAKCVEQANCVTRLPEGNVDTEADAADNNKKTLEKKYMKQGVALAADYLQTTLRLDVSVIDVEVLITDNNDVIRTAGCLASCFLDAGCARIVLQSSSSACDASDSLLLLQDAMEAARLPRERLMVHAVAADSSSSSKSSCDLLLSIIQQVKDDCDAVSVFVEEEFVNQETLTELLATAKDSSVKGIMDVVVQIRPKKGSNDSTATDTAALAQMVGAALKTTPHDSCGTTISLIDPTVQQLGQSYAACLGTDRTDNLYTTVVCTRTGEALGLVYSSVESIVAALECGRGVYYSRSRNSLWRKGDTSGHYQTLHRIDVDCDGDAVRFTVTQQRPVEAAAAAFCHLETLTCWGPPRGLRHLEETLQERLKSAPEGSYTKRLFDDAALLQDKLVEEAQELAEADTPRHVAEELADVLYFSMVRAAKFGVSIDDAAAELDRRTRKVTRRKGDSKAFRIEAGKAILEQVKGNK